MIADPEYRTLADVLAEAFAQAQDGKGKDRHASGESFEQQPIVAINESLGSNHGAIFQAIKKAHESTRLPYERARFELLGAINYLAAAIIVLDREVPEPQPESEYEVRNRELHRLARMAGKI